MLSPLVDVNYTVHIYFPAECAHKCMPSVNSDPQLVVKLGLKLYSEQWPLRVVPLCRRHFVLFAVLFYKLNIYCLWCVLY